MCDVIWVGTKCYGRPKKGERSDRTDQEDQEAGCRADSSPCHDSTWSGRWPKTQSEMMLRCSTQEMGKVLAIKRDMDCWKEEWIFREDNESVDLALKDSRTWEI